MEEGLPTAFFGIYGSRARLIMLLSASVHRRPAAVRREHGPGGMDSRMDGGNGIGCISGITPSIGIYFWCSGRMGVYRTKSALTTGQQTSLVQGPLSRPYLVEESTNVSGASSSRPRPCNLQSSPSRSRVWACPEQELN